MRDVAAHAGVSIKTVSRVVNEANNVRTHVRDRVLRSIRELNYSPDVSARALVNRRISMQASFARREYWIAVPFDSAFGEFPTGIYDDSIVTDRFSMQSMLFACDATQGNLARELEAFVERVGAAGLLLHPPFCDMAELLDALDRANIRFVRLDAGTRTDLARSVFTDDHDACAKAIGHFAELGHSRIAFIMGHSHDPRVARRYLGYRDGLKRAGLSMDPQLLMRGDGSFESGLAATRHLLDRAVPERPTAIMTSDDEIAAAALLAARELGIMVPTELSIMGFGDRSVASQVWPTLTTIRYPAAELTRVALKMLASQIHDEHSTLCVQRVNCSFMKRQSTAAVPTR